MRAGSNRPGMQRTAQSPHFRGTVSIRVHTRPILGDMRTRSSSQVFRSPFRASSRGRLVVWSALACVVVSLCPGCGSDAPKPKSVAEVTVTLARVMVKGFDYNGQHVSAERFDAVSGELYEVRISGKDQVLFASRARICVDTDRNVMWLELTGVTVARPDESGGNGGLWWTSDSMTLDPVDLGDLDPNLSSDKGAKPSK